MHSKAVLTLAMALTTLANAAIVGALINVDNPSAIELPTTPQNDITARAAGRVFLARRETDPLACDGYCGDKSELAFPIMPPSPAILTRGHSALLPHLRPLPALPHDIHAMQQGQLP